LIAHLAIALGAGVIFGIFMRKIIDEGMDLYEQAMAEGFTNVIIAVHSGTCPSRFHNPRDLVRNGISVDSEVITHSTLLTGSGNCGSSSRRRHFSVY
jgi:hypothetical protein